MSDIHTEGLLRRLLDAAIAAADPSVVLAAHLPEKPKGRCIVVGAGKSAASMARAVEKAWPDVPLSGVVVTRTGHSLPTEHIEVREAAHPVPDAAGAKAAEEIMALVAEAGPDDLILALISGGGSALTPMPKPPLTFDELVTVNKRLLSSGLSINEMNRVRRRLSLIHGGGLARAAGKSRIVTLAISDVPGDDPSAIASGPTVPDPTQDCDLSYLLGKLGPELPAAAAQLLSGGHKETPLGKVDFRLIATPQKSLEAAAKIAEESGVSALILGDAIEGEARELGIAMAGIAISAAKHHRPLTPPMVVISGGETTVTIGEAPPGRGGRNMEFLLSLAIALEGHPQITAIAADTDGIDGTEPAAGALITPTFLSEAELRGLSPRDQLQNHDSYTILEQLGALVVTGPTLTNVNDFRAVLVT